MASSSNSFSSPATLAEAPGGDPDSDQPPQKVVACVLLAFGGRPDLEEEFQKEHAAARARYDAIRALLRLAAWVGFTARAAGRASAGLRAVMSLASLLYSLAPLLLLALSPEAFLSWRRYWVTAWNVGHAAMVLTFAPQLYQLAPPGVAAASLAAAEGSGASLATSLGRLLWLLWYSQALIMALNGGGPLTNTFRHFLQGQLLITMLHTKLNAIHCTSNPAMLSAVHVVHSRLVLPAAALLAGHGGAPRPVTTAAAAHRLCSAYLPLLQLGQGLLLPCCIVYRQERALRRQFLAKKGMRLERVQLRCELGMALLAAALQLAAILTLEAAA